MVRRTIQAITTRISGLGEAAFWLSLFALFSQILALLRDRLLAYHFGASASLDVYYAAFKIPDIIFVTVASLVSISALVPLFAKKESEGEKHLKEATFSIFTVFSVLIMVTCLVAWFFMPQIVSLSFSGFSAALQTQTILLSRILLFSPLLLGFSNFFGSIVQYEKRFILYSLSPLLYNIGIILGIILLVENMGVSAAIIGVVFGALLHFLLQALFVIFSPMRPKFTSHINWGMVFETAKLSVPRTFALSITSFLGLFFASVASTMEEGSIAVFNFSWNLQSVPLSLIGVSFSLAAFPALAISAANRNTEEVIEKISDGLRQIIFWSLPFTAFIVVLRAHIVRLVLGSGSFNWSDTRLVAASLSLFVISAVFQSIQLFLSRSHYALGRTKWPLFGNIVGGLVTVLMTVVMLNNYSIFAPMFSFFANFLKVSDLSTIVLVLPMAFTLGSILSALVLFFALGHNLSHNIFNKIKTSARDTSISAVFFGVGSYFALSVLDGLFDLETFLGVFGHAFFAFIIGVALGLTSLYLIGSSEFKNITEAIRAKYKQYRAV